MPDLEKAASDRALNLEGRVAVLEQAIKCVLINCVNVGDVQNLVDTLRELTQAPGGVVYMHDFPEPMKRGMNFTTDVLAQAIDLKPASDQPVKTKAG